MFGVHPAAPHPLIYFLHLEIAPDLASSGDPRLGHEKVRKTEGLWGEREQRIRASETGREAFKAHPAPLGASPPRPAHAGGARRSGSGSHGAYKPGGRARSLETSPPCEPRTRSRAPAQSWWRGRVPPRGGARSSDLGPATAGAAEPGGRAGAEPVCVGGRLRPRPRWPASPGGEAVSPQAADTWSVSSTAAF